MSFSTKQKLKLNSKLKRENELKLNRFFEIIEIQNCFRKTKLKRKLNCFLKTNEIKLKLNEIF